MSGIDRTRNRTGRRVLRAGWLPVLVLVVWLLIVGGAVSALGLPQGVAFVLGMVGGSVSVLWTLTRLDW